MSNDIVYGWLCHECVDLGEIMQLETLVGHALLFHGVTRDEMTKFVLDAIPRDSEVEDRVAAAFAPADPKKYAGNEQYAKSKGATMTFIHSSRILGKKVYAASTSTGDEEHDTEDAGDKTPLPKSETPEMNQPKTKRRKLNKTAYSSAKTPDTISQPSRVSQAAPSTTPASSSTTFPFGKCDNCKNRVECQFNVFGKPCTYCARRASCKYAGQSVFSVHWPAYRTANPTVTTANYPQFTPVYLTPLVEREDRRRKNT